VEVAAAVPFGVSRVLDVGCGAGALGSYLKRQGVREVVGIEYVESACKLAAKVLDNAIPGSIESLEIPYEDGYFDCVIFADVLEHLVDPAAALCKVARVLADDGIIITSIPNVRYFQVLGMLAGGRWEYMDAGILDRTHLRFFTAVEMRLLMQGAGLEVLLQAPLSQAWPEMAQLDENRMLRMGLLSLGPLSEAEYSDLRTYQYLVVAGKPGVDRLTRGHLAFESQQYEEAFRRAATAYGVDEANRHKLLAASVARLGNLAQAEELYRKAAALRPGDAEVASQLGVLLVATGRYGEAEDCLLRALSLNPDDHRALGALGLVHSANGRADVAFETIRKSLMLDFHSDGLVRQALTLAAQLGRIADLAEPLDNFLNFYPGSLDIACQYIALLIDAGRMPEARSRLETLSLLAPDNPDVAALMKRLPE
jgi:2-polyprenyl-3-methyl-5-hydroxy-6-metoxy-1,4-benzoquinol methylase/thioredoxin-like negative regulator of GroEL